MSVTIANPNCVYCPQEGKYGGICSHHGHVQGLPGVIWEGIQHFEKAEPQGRIYKSNQRQQEVVLSVTKNIVVNYCVDICVCACKKS